MRNLPKIFLRSFENVAPDSMICTVDLWYGVCVRRCSSRRWYGTWRSTGDQLQWSVGHRVWQQIRQHWRCRRVSHAWIRVIYFTVSPTSAMTLWYRTHILEVCQNNNLNTKNKQFKRLPRCCWLLGGFMTRDCYWPSANVKYLLLFCSVQWHYF